MKLSAKTILITGASDGIGKATALRLAKEKTSLILLGRNEKALRDVKSACEKNGAISATKYTFDLADTNSATAHLEKIKTNHQELSAILNVAGVWQKLGDLDLFNHKQIENIINTNLTGLINLTNTLLPLLRTQKEAAIINISSRSGYSAQAGQSIYSASKYGVRGFTEVLYQDLKDTHIRVAGVYQGGTNTQMFMKAGDDFGEEKLKTFIPPEELAEVIAFMLSRTNRVWLPEVRVESR